MDAMTPVKQMITFQKTFFENSYETTCRLQRQAEEMNKAMLDHWPLMSEPGKKMIDESMTMGKKAQENFKKAVDEGFTKFEALFNIK